jgi:hypothetical protein
MPSTYTANGGIELPANGEQAGTWGNVVNSNMAIIDRLTSGVGYNYLTGTTGTISIANAILSNGHYPVIIFNGAPSGENTVSITPSTVQRVFILKNTTSENVVISQGTGAGGTVTLVPGESKIVYAAGASGGASSVNTVEDLSGSFTNLSTLFGGTVTGSVTVAPEDGSVSTVSYPITLSHQVTGSPSSGVGTGLIFATETTSGNTEQGSVIESVSTNVGASTEAFNLVLKTMSAGTLGERLKLFATGAGATSLTRAEFTPYNDIATSINNNTTDGADSATMYIAGGGSFGSSRGGYAFFNGNETASSGGFAAMSAGNITDAKLVLDAPHTTGNIELYTNGAARMVIDQNGIINVPDSAAGATNYLSFGAGSDLRLWHDGSNSYIADAGTGGLNVLTGLYSLKNAANSQTMLTATEGAAVSLYYNNSIKLATTTGGVAITGALTTTGDITAFFTSDQRLKTNIVHIENALEKMDQIGGYTYDWLPESGKEGSTVGVLAQELQTVLPEAVSLRDNGYLAVRYENIIPLLIEAIKELRQEVKILKGK